MKIHTDEKPIEQLAFGNRKSILREFGPTSNKDKSLIGFCQYACSTTDKVTNSSKFSTNFAT